MKTATYKTYYVIRIITVRFPKLDFPLLTGQASALDVAYRRMASIIDAVDGANQAGKGVPPTAVARATRRRGQEALRPAQAGAGTTGLDKPDARGRRP